ncbi:Zinc finger matrin-type protein 4 [Takifugu flavidus]|uniref:Zinc finger matrin-type protein 4 n=1 Tax=Takifugu flavidus TaxID=433684 RepID=A0A5C6N3E2_9TELE|nr:Zinc finger matrin-type protein 4 [Takifugu flavidus]
MAARRGGARPRVVLPRGRSAASSRRASRSAPSPVSSLLRFMDYTVSLQHQLAVFPTHVYQGYSVELQMKSTEVDQGLFTDSYCKVCSAQLISESQRVAHYEVRTPTHMTSHHIPHFV